MRIAVLGNYLPRKCGIATFTSNLTTSISAATDRPESEQDIFVVALNDRDQEYEYPDIVKYTIRQHELDDYRRAAEYINESAADICIVQHEFGIYGGESGLFLLTLLRELKVPIITTMHTVLQTPGYYEKHIIKKLGDLSQKVVVMSKLAVNFLTAIYRIPLQKISIIHHGVPDFSHPVKGKATFNYPGKKVLGTFGFLGRSKGIETVINALPDLVSLHPDIVYVVLGQTHPNVKKYCGEEYRDYLKNLAIRNAVDKYIIFEDDFFEEADLINFLLGVDIYIIPYLNEGQITSGTLSYAVGAGACVVSTPFWHAKEVLIEGRGKTFAFGDSRELADILSDLLTDPQKISAIKESTFDYGKNIYWNKIGYQYKKLISKVLSKPLFTVDKYKYKRISSLPKFNLDHIKRLTDNTGILEHSNYSVPDYKEGYCLDDNARALILVLTAYELGIDRESIGLADTYLRYINLMQKKDGSFHNDLSFSKEFMDETGSEDSFGRTIWAIGLLIRLAPNDSHLQFSKDIFFRSLPQFENVQSIRAVANIIIGLCNFLKRYPDNEKGMHVLNILTDKLIRQYYDESDDNWKWFEPILCYDNAILPLALWYAYSITRNKTIFDVADESTNFIDNVTCKNEYISLAGGTWRYEGKTPPLQAQQPINAMALVMMYNKAYLVTKNQKYHDKMLIAFSWFLGNNDLSIPLFDEESKGCCDGLEKTGVNRNQGAESTISYHLAYLTVWSTEFEIMHEQNIYNPKRTAGNNVISLGNRLSEPRKNISINGA